MEWNNYLNPKRLRPSQRENKDIDSRNEFESDFGRTIFSPAIRRMHDKTQVFPLTSDDNVHSRLTHSMEVMAIGHSLGLRLCSNENFIKRTNMNANEIHRNIPVILKNACLVHDIGNPPFGHFGETVIQKYFQHFFERKPKNQKKQKNKPIIELKNRREEEDFIHFDGNAQGFRVLTKLQVLDDTFGLNLTYGSLAAYLKYPNSEALDDSKLSTKKRGVFQSEKEYLNQIVEGCGLSEGGIIKRHPLSFLMEAADTICYCVMDIEDGFNRNIYSYNYVKEYLESLDMPNKGALTKKLKELESIQGRGSEVTKFVKLRIFLISELVQLAINNFVLNLDSICEGTYNKELVYDDPNNLAASLMDICKKKIFNNREVVQLELTGHSVIKGLLDYYIEFLFSDNKQYRKRALATISKSTILASTFEYKVETFEELSNYYKLRVIIDFISGMTDKFALKTYQKISGQKII
jgi:dGTPase